MPDERWPLFYIQPSRRLTLRSLEIFMNHYDSQITAKETLKATPEEYSALKAALQQDEDDGGWFEGYQVFYQTGEVFVAGCFGEGDCRCYPPEFLLLLARLIAKNGLDYLEFGESITSIEPRVGSTGGTYFRIRRDGSRWDPTLVW